jgi:hypothetical protein
LTAWPWVVGSENCDEERYHELCLPERKIDIFSSWERFTRGSTRALDTSSRNPDVRFDVWGRETEPLAKPGRCRGACSTPDRLIPVIARSPCDEAIQGLLHVAPRRLPRTRFRTILSAFANRPSGISMPRAPCVYIMASDRNGTIYTGVTSNHSSASTNTARASGRVSRGLSAPAAGCSTRPVNAWMKRSRAKSRSRAARAPRRWP